MSTNLVRGSLSVVLASAPVLCGGGSLVVVGGCGLCMLSRKYAFQKA